MPKKSEYEQLYDNEPFEVKSGENTLRLACCDCSLVHDISVKIPKTGRKIILTINRNNKATAKLRKNANKRRKV